MRLFSTEQVSKFHPDKYADQISDAILDRILKEDPNARVAVETLVKGRTVVVAGEVTASNLSEDNITGIVAWSVHKVADKLKYKVDKIVDLIENQSPEIANAVNQADGIGAGDQGLMFEYATIKSDSLLPWGFDFANRIISIIEDDVDYNPHTILKGDAKVQVTVNLDAPSPEASLHTLLISARHIEYVDTDQLKTYILELLEENGIQLDPQVRVLINPAGEWTIGGPEADAGLTGRKIVCDQYGGFVPVGGGAFSGKDPSKVDRSASYMARYLATKAIYKYAEDGLQWIEIQLAYAIGVKKPVSVIFKSNLKEQEKLQEINAWINSFDLTPSGIIKYLELTENPNYERRAEGCHYYLHVPKDEE